MTAKDVNRVKERCRARRRNLKRYVHTQSFTRLAGCESPVDDGGGVFDMERSRFWLLTWTAALLGPGLFFLIF